VYVSDNGGKFTRFLKGTTKTSAVFTGKNGHTNRFYSVATDKAGNRQATPTKAQATTTIKLAHPAAYSQASGRFNAEVDDSVLIAALEQIWHGAMTRRRVQS
jgi:hypothetical protein